MGISFRLMEKNFRELLSRAWRGRGRKYLGTIMGMVMGVFLWHCFETMPRLHNLELGTFDLRMTTSPVKKVSSKVLFVDVDDQSLRLFGRWPWSRDRFKTLLDVLDEFGAGNAVFDIEFIGNSVGMTESSEVFRKISGIVGTLDEALRADRGKLENLTSELMKFLEYVSGLGEESKAELRVSDIETLAREVKRGNDSLAAVLLALSTVESYISELASLVSFNLAGPDERFCSGLRDFGRATLAYHFQTGLNEADQNVAAADMQISEMVRKRENLLFSELPSSMRAAISAETLRHLLRVHRIKELLKEGIDLPPREIEQKLGLGEGYAVEDLEEARKRAIFEGSMDILEANPGISLSGLMEKLSVSLGSGRAGEVSREDFLYGATRALTHWHILRNSPVSVLGRQRIQVPESRLLEGPPLQLCQSATMAFVNATPDSDGVFRRVPMFYQCDGKLFPQLALTGFLKERGVYGQTLEITEDRKLRIPGAGLKSEIPLTSHGELIINWAGPYGGVFDHVPAAALLDFQRMRQELDGELARISDKYESGLLKVLRSRKRDLQELLKASPSALAGDFPQFGDYDPAQPLAQVLETISQEEEKALARLRSGMDKNMEKLERALEKVASRPDRLAQVEKRISDLKADMAVMDDYRIRIQRSASRLNELVNNRICLIGMTATSTTDIGVTPFQKRYPMVGIHGNILNTLLTERHIVRDTPGIRLLLFLALGGVTGFVVPGFRIKSGGSLCLLLGVLYTLAATVFYRKLGLWLALAGPLTLILVNYTLISFIRFITEEKEKKFIKGAFGQYLSPKIIEQIMEDPSRLRLGGEKKVCTAFFSDVAGFSTISEKLTPEELVQLLNEYLTEMTNIILSFDGTVDKYEGDAIIAIFGAPINYDDHARRACEASVMMQKRLIELREKWRQEGKQELTVRIGLNTGPMVVGNMGSIQRMDYTMMGDSVNLASRLEGANKPYGTYVMISEFTYEHCREHVVVRELDKIRVVGKKEPVTVYELVDMKGCPTEETLALLSGYEQALGHYKAGKWDQALEGFRALLEKYPQDGPSGTYVERCGEFKASPPPADWDGVYVLKSK